MMEKRINLHALAPQAYKALIQLEEYLAKGSLSKIHKELIKIRTSQINQCAHCLNMHTRDALKNGETQQRIFLLSAWRETDIFTDEEKAILQVAEEVTLISQKGLSDEAYNNALKYFDENYLAQIIFAIVAINSWNRLAVSTHLPID